MFAVVALPDGAFKGTYRYVHDADKKAKELALLFCGCKFLVVKCLREYKNYPQVKRSYPSQTWK